MPAEAKSPDGRMRLAKIIIIGVVLIVFGFWFRTALRPARKGPPINEWLVPFQGDWRAAPTAKSNSADVTIHADRRKSPHTITLKEGSSVRHFNLGSHTIWQREQHLAGIVFWKEHPQYPSTSSIVAIDIRLEGTNLLFTLGPYTSDQPAPLDISAATLVCTRR
jgi:hypothetical protein